MVMQLTRHVVDCPVCGRPLEVQSEYIGHELACGHCRGRFVVYDNDPRGLTTAGLGRMDALQRAEALLHLTGQMKDRQSNRQSNQLLDLLSIVEDDDRCGEGVETSPTDEEQVVAEQPVVVLVEHRDEVFARVATDMAEAGVRIIRAMTATEALQLCGIFTPVLVVANVELPDQSGWLLAGKLRFIDRGIRVWLYQGQSSEYDEGMASYLQVDELLDYGGDLLGLSETIMDLMADRREPPSASKDARELVAA